MTEHKSMTQCGGRVEISSCGSACRPAPLQQRSVQAFVLTAAILACLFIAWDFPESHDSPGPGNIGVQVDLNSASTKELSLVPGIGPTLARRIIENRQRVGPFPTLDSLQRVRGIGPRTAERVAKICVIVDDNPRLAIRTSPDH